MPAVSPTAESMFYICCNGTINASYRCGGISERPTPTSTCRHLLQEAAVHIRTLPECHAETQLEGVRVCHIQPVG